MLPSLQLHGLVYPKARMEAREGQQACPLLPFSFAPARPPPHLPSKKL